MAKIPRYTGNLLSFGVNATALNRTVFGDTTQSDTLDDNVNSDFLLGWEIVGANEAPTKQDFNAMGFTLGQLIAYLYQTGVPEWDSAQEFHTDSVTNRNGVLYISQANTNTGNDPELDDGTNWLMLPSSGVGYDNSTSGLTAENVQAAIDELVVGGTTQWIGTPVGGVIGLATNLTGVDEPPTDNPNFRYVKLTAGEDGVGQYNEGVVTNESITGSAPLVVATVDIDDTDSPFDGETINLWNTENRYPKPGETAGVASNDQMQGHTHTIQMTADDGNTKPNVKAAAINVSNESISGPVTDGVNGTPRIGTYTDVKHETLVYYMRIR